MTSLQDFDIDLTFYMYARIDKKICPNYYDNMTRAYRAKEPDEDMDTYINARVPIVSEPIASSYFFPDLFITEATTVSDEHSLRGEYD